MKKIWPATGETKAEAVCMSKTERMAFGYGSMLPLICFGVALLIVGMSLGADRSLRPGGWVLGLVGVAMIGAGLEKLVKLNRDDRIARTGESAWAAVTEVRAGSAAVSFRRAYKLRYRYKDGGGVDHEGAAKVYGSTWDKYAGEPLLVRYDPRQPERSAIAWNGLGQTKAY